MTADKLTEKRLTSDPIYKGRIVSLSVDTVELPNGKTSKRELVQHPGAVAMVPVDPQGNITMVRQFRYAANKILLELPAGTLNPSEAPEVCAARELQRKLALRPTSWSTLAEYSSHPGPAPSLSTYIWQPDSQNLASIWMKMSLSKSKAIRLKC